MMCTSCKMSILMTGILLGLLPQVPYPEMILLSLCEVSMFEISKGLYYASPFKNIENNHRKLESYQPSDLSLLSEEVC